MTNSQCLDSVRTALIAWLNDQDDDGKVAVVESESLLMVDGFYRGRRFKTPTALGTWFIEEDELKIHSATDGSLLCVMDKDQITAAADGPQVLKIQRPDTEEDIRRAA